MYVDARAGRQAQGRYYQHQSRHAVIIVVVRLVWLMMRLTVKKISEQQIIAVVVSILFQWLSILCIDTVFLGSPEYCDMYRNTFVSILIVSSLGLRGSSKGSPWFDRKWGRRTFRGQSRCFHRAWWKHWQQTILDSFAILEFGMPAHDWAKCQKNIHQLPGNRTVSELFSSQAMIAERSKQAPDLDIIGLTIKCNGGRWQLWLMDHDHSKPAK